MAAPDNPRGRSSRPSRWNRLRSKPDGKEAALAAKKNAAATAIERVPHDCVLGVGTGSTTNEFIALLPGIRERIARVASSSDASTELLQSLGFEVSPLTACGTLDLYVDGADETDDHRRLIKGGGAALTGEKILVSSSRRFVCIVDESKRVKLLGKFPLPVEVIPMARSAVARKLVQLGGQPQYREGVITDYGNEILDVHNLKILDPPELETEINQIPGVVTVGLFARHRPEVVIVGTAEGSYPL